MDIGRQLASSHPISTKVTLVFRKRALRFPEVRVAILSAMETVNPKVPSTVEAGALCRMADSVMTRLASCGEAVLVANARKEVTNKVVPS